MVLLLVDMFVHILCFFQRWHFHSIKGSFYKEDDGIIESHSYELKIMQPTRLWMSVKTIAPKYGKFSFE